MKLGPILCTTSRGVTGEGRRYRYWLWRDFRHVLLRLPWPWEPKREAVNRAVHDATLRGFHEGLRVPREEVAALLKEIEA